MNGRSTYTEQNLPPLLRHFAERPWTSASTGLTSQRQLSESNAAASPGPFFDAVYTSEAVELYSLVRELRPTHSAEVGFCCGGSALAILKALEDNGFGTHHVCDPYQTNYAHRAGLSNVEQSGLAHRLDFHEEFPENVIPSLPPLQFAFIDASHLYDLSMMDFVLVDKRLEVGGVVGLHDLWMPSLQALVRFMVSNRGYEVLQVDRAADAPKPAGLKHWAARLLRRLPQSERIFSSSVLRPWADFGIAGNMAFLKKTTDDRRGWRHFVPF